MGEGTTRAVREIEETRERLQDGLEELAGRLPGIPEAAEAGKKVLLPAAGAAAGAVMVWLVDRRIRRKRAEAAAARVVPDEWAQAFREGNWKGPATVAAGLWGLVRIAEARSIRRLGKALAKANGPGRAGRR